MIVTCGASAAAAAAPEDEPPAAAAPEDPDALLAQAARLEAASTAAPRAARRRVVVMNSPLSGVVVRWSCTGAAVGAAPGSGGSSLDCRTSVGLGWAPAEQAPLEEADEPLGRQGDDRDEDHSGQH